MKIPLEATQTFNELLYEHRNISTDFSLTNLTVDTHPRASTNTYENVPKSMINKNDIQTPDTTCISINYSNLKDITSTIVNNTDTHSRIQDTKIGHDKQTHQNPDARQSLVTSDYNNNSATNIVRPYNKPKRSSINIHLKQNLRKSYSENLNLNQNLANRQQIGTRIDLSSQILAYDLETGDKLRDNLSNEMRQKVTSKSYVPSNYPEQIQLVEYNKVNNQIVLSSSSFSKQYQNSQQFDSRNFQQPKASQNLSHNLKKLRIENDNNTKDYTLPIGHPTPGKILENQDASCKKPDNLQQRNHFSNFTSDKLCPTTMDSKQKMIDQYQKTSKHVPNDVTNHTNNNFINKNSANTRDIAENNTCNTEQRNLLATTCQNYLQPCKTSNRTVSGESHEIHNKNVTTRQNVENGNQSRKQPLELKSNLTHEPEPNSLISSSRDQSVSYSNIDFRKKVIHDCNSKLYNDKKRKSVYWMGVVFQSIKVAYASKSHI